HRQKPGRLLPDLACSHRTDPWRTCLFLFLPLYAAKTRNPEDAYAFLPEACPPCAKTSDPFSSFDRQPGSFKSSAKYRSCLHPSEAAALWNDRPGSPLGLWGADRNGSPLHPFSQRTDKLGLHHASSGSGGP